MKMYKKYSPIIRRNWILLEEYVDFPPLIAYDFIRRRASYFHWRGAGFLDSAILYRDGRAYSCVEQTSLFLNKRLLFQRLLIQPDWYERLYKPGDQILKQLRRLIKRQPESEARLVSYFRELYRLFMRMALLGQPINIVEFHDSLFTKYLKNYLNKKLSAKSTQAIAQVYVILTNPSGQYKQREAMEAMLDQKHRQFFRLASTVIASKQERYKVLIDYKAVLDRISKSLGRVHGLPLDYLMHLTYNQAIRFLQTHDKENYRSSSFSTKLSGVLFYHGKEYRLTSEEVLTLLDKVNSIPSNVKCVIGQGIVPGRVQGAVKIVNKAHDAAKVKKGNIVISHATSVEITSALEKAAAVVSDIGGITCHAGIVSRELGIPCVVGTKIATRVFHDGDKVEVDATNGIVKKL